MSAISPEARALKVEIKHSALQRELSENQSDDFELIQLDTTFITLISQISGFEPRQDGRIDLQARPNRRSALEEVRQTRRIEKVLARLDPVERAIMAIPARTIVGLGIKARHAAYVVSEHWDAPIEQIDRDAQAVRLLIEAVCKVAGIGLPFPGNSGR
ncbi:hypothetical protein [Bradyrhizobium sp. SZCCHNRI1029]|uniref:hypothetical protein n=1 Tax=Bradyrhizobium sp. SZCCHNRI1029 TaxID=3057278 RepID=UPI0029161F2F|nr:hypothetical protein [Bradyrhizobium sp. SZCCHNRI1029]